MKYMKGWGNFGPHKDQKGLTDEFERGKKTFQFSDLFVLKDRAFNAVKRDAEF